MTTEINLKSIIASMLRRSIWLIMVPVVCASLMFAVLSFENSTYTAKVEFMSKNLTTKVDYNNSTLQNAKKAEIDNYSKMLTSDLTLRRVAQKLTTKYGSYATISDIRSMITISVPDGTSVMVVSVTGESPKLVENICDSLADIFIPIVEESYQSQNILQCLSNEYTPVENKPDMVKPAIIAALVGFVAAFAVCFVIAYNDKTISTAEEAKKLMDIPVIGVVPR